MKARKANVKEDIEQALLRQFTLEDMDGHRITFHHDLRLILLSLFTTKILTFINQINTYDARLE